MIGLKILIVDDDPLISDLIRRKLIKTEPSLNITSVSSAAECLAYIAGNPVDCIISDYQMPGMDGMELLEHLRKSGDVTPFIFVTGQGNEEVAREAFKRGAYDYFTKEIGFAHFDRITNSVRQAVKHRRAEDVRRQTELMLAEQKNKLDAIIAGIADGLCIVDHDFMLGYCNQAYLDMIGDHIGKHCYEFIEGNNRVCDDCPVERTFKDGQVHRSRKSAVINNRVLVTDVSSSPLRDHNGNIISAVKVVRDVTEQSIAERVVAESEDKFRTLAEKSPNMIFINQGGSIVYANDLCEKMTGYTRDELYDPGFDFRRLIAPESMDFVESNFMKHMQGQNVDPYEYGLLTKNGNTLTVLITTRLINFGDGRAILGIVTDITERTFAEKALRESEARLRTLMENANDAILLADAETGVVVDANKKAGDIIGYPAEKLIGMHQSGLHPSAEIDRYKAIFADHVARGEALAGDLRIQRSDGSTLPVEISASVVEIGGRKIMIGLFRDITERKRAEEEKDRLMKGISTITDGIAFVDKDGRYIYMNDAHARMFGYEADELIGRTWRDIVPPDKVESIEETKRTTLHVREIGKLAGEGMGLRKDGVLFPLEINLAGFFDAEGEFEGHVCIARDITGRKAIEEKLAKSEESYKEAEDIARLGNWEWVIDRDEVNWSDGMFVIFGLDPAEFGKTYHSYLDYVHPDDKERVMGLVAQSLNGTPLDYATRVICPDGREKVIHVYGRLSYDADGRPIRLFGTVQDITEQTVAEKALRASEERHRVIFETSAIGILVADPKGNIYEANPAFCGMVGYSEDELINMTVFELTYPADAKESQRLTAELNSGHRDVIDVEKRYVHRDGRIVWARSTVTRHHVLGMIQPYNIGFIQDITGRKSLETQREELFSMLRHDMKTPLAIISGNADMVMSDCCASLDSESLGMIEAMKSSALSLTRMVDDLVAISRLETSDIALDKEPVDIVELLMETSVVASERSRTKGLNYEKDILADLPETLINRSYVQRAVANLLDNAVKYTPPGGSVSFKAGITSIDGNSFIAISVSDTGPGISENEKEMVFAKHYRSPRTPSQSGSGLGLSIVKAVAGLHGGSVELTSREEEGSTFTLNIPVA
jgi:PAS domain S-box-containing protein